MLLQNIFKVLIALLCIKYINLTVMSVMCFSSVGFIVLGREERQERQQLHCRSSETGAGKQVDRRTVWTREVDERWISHECVGRQAVCDHYSQGINISCLLFFFLPPPHSLLLTCVMTINRHEAGRIASVTWRLLWLMRRI